MFLNTSFYFIVSETVWIDFIYYIKYMRFLLLFFYFYHVSCFFKMNEQFGRLPIPLFLHYDWLYMSANVCMEWNATRNGCDLTTNLRVWMFLNTSFYFIVSVVSETVWIDFIYYIKYMRFFLFFFIFFLPCVKSCFFKMNEQFGRLPIPLFLHYDWLYMSANVCMEWNATRNGFKKILQCMEMKWSKEWI